jgi:hypothetical protein
MLDNYEGPFACLRISVNDDSIKHNSAVLTY